MQGNLFGGLECSFHLVHGVDPARLFRVDHVYRRSAASSHLGIPKERHVQRKGFHGVGREPERDLLHVTLAGVVEMVARGKNLDSLRASLG